MIPQTWTTIDKTGWPRGPWDNEPDKEQFTDEATGLPCLVKRNGSGSLCGYVGVAEGHPWFGKDYDNLGDSYPEVHGGLTYADFCMEGDEAKTICHIPGPGEPDRVWWLGFDCAHLGDLSPAYQRAYSQFSWASNDTYKDVAYVKAECASLAAQVAAVAS